MPEQALAGLGVAITRPSGQATRLTELVQAAGGHVYAWPLIAIAALPDYADFEQRLHQLDRCDWLIFISSNAVQHAMPRILARHGGMPPQLHCAAIGPVTASELAGFGVHQVLTPQQRFDSEALLALPQMQQVQGQRILIVRGVGGRELMAQTLQARGAEVTFAECYRRINPQTDANFIAGLWQNRQLQALVITSSEAMRHLLQLAADAPWLRQLWLCVNHARIAEQPLALGLRVAIADAPGDDAMLRCLILALTRTDTE